MKVQMLIRLILIFFCLSMMIASAKADMNEGIEWYHKRHEGSNGTLASTKNINKAIEIDPDSTGALGFKASILAHLDRIEEAKDFLAQYQEKRPEVKNISDYEKVAPTIIKEVLIEGLVKAGMPNE